MNQTTKDAVPSDHEMFERYLDQPFSELAENDLGRNDPRRLCFEDFGVPMEIIFHVWQAARAATTSEVAQAPFQSRVQPWMLECFGAEIAADKIERNHRFFEEATEAVQANGMTRSEAHQLVDYTFDRPVGELHQEIGGVMVTLAALCLASGQDMHAAGETELARIWTKVEAIRAKQAAKPKHSPLPVAPTPETVAPIPAFITAQHIADFQRLYAVLEDGEGYDIPKPRMESLADTGLIRKQRGSVYEFTQFGLVMQDALLAATAQSDAEKKS